MINIFNSGLVKWLQILIQNCIVLLKPASNIAIIDYSSIYPNIGPSIYIYIYIYIYTYIVYCDFLTEIINCRLSLGVGVEYHTKTDYVQLVTSSATNIT